MRILFLISARNWGGNEKWVAMAAQVLAEHYDVRVAYRCAVVGERMAALPGVTTVRWPFVAAFDGWTLSRLVDYIRREDIDILIPTKRKDYFLAGIAAQLTGARNVLRLGIVRRLHRWSHQRWVYGSWADGIIVNAPNIREELLASGLLEAERIAVIPNGVDQGVVAAVGENTEPPFPFTVVTVGKLSERKDVATLLRGVAQLYAKRTGFGVVVVGDGPARGQLERLAKELGIAEQVVFRGYQINPYPDLAAAQVFVSTSRNEGFPNTVIEALYLGVPIIATAAGGTWEWLQAGRDGIRIPFADPSALAEALNGLYDDKDQRQQLAARGRESAQERFDLQQMGKCLSEFLEKLIKKPQ